MEGFFALHGAEKHVFQNHETLTNKTLGTTRTLEALWLSMPGALSIGHSLCLRFNGILASHTDHCIVLHVAGLTDWMILFHDISFPSQDTVTVKATEVLQMPV